jgi:energy-converting hydrogenase Eha subunit C
MQVRPSPLEQLVCLFLVHGALIQIGVIARYLTIASRASTAHDGRADYV